MNIFKFQDTQLRTIDIDGAPWFHATDLAKCIGLNVSKGTTKMLRPLEADERKLVTPESFRGVGRSATFISESGFYKFVMNAQRKRPEVAVFQDWVTREVLPAIRKTGGYLLNEEARQVAHADTRDMMPLVGELFAQMEERLKAHISETIKAQFGHLLTPQWIDKDGKAHVIAEMTNEHLRRARKFASPLLLSVIEAELNTRRAAAATEKAAKVAEAQQAAASVLLAAEAEAKAILASVR